MTHHDFAEATECSFCKSR